MSKGAARIAVEVAYATKERQTVIELELEAGATVEDAIARSGIRGAHPEIGLTGTGVGIYGSLVSPGRVLQEGDRVEIYRPLEADPRETRRRRAGPGKTRNRNRKR